MKPSLSLTMEHNNQKKLLSDLGPMARVDVPMAQYTTLKVGGPADIYYEAKNRDQLVTSYRLAKKYSVPVFVFGGGSNILVGDRGIRGLVIKNSTKDIVVRGVKGKFEHGNSSGQAYVEADSGVIFNSFVRFTIEEGYKGIEMHLGLPGTVGGAVYMNSKWTHPVGYVGDVLYQATILTENGEEQIVPHSYFQFAYDSSILQKTKEIVLSGTFLFTREPKEVLWQRANDSIAYRRQTQPAGVSTLGCTFRNISQAQAMTIPTPGNTTSVGYLIDQAGLKGHTVGRAQISSVHANFIVNLGGATAVDIIGLIETIKQRVGDRFGVTLEEEIIRVGEF
jgi:UDP-N-acetylenolpyruvoylglucosamine reductase